MKVKVASLMAQMVNLCLQCGRPGFDPWVRKIPGEGNGNPLQYPCLENPMDGVAWYTTVHGGRKESDMTERHHFHFLSLYYFVLFNLKMRR